MANANDKSPSSPEQFEPRTATAIGSRWPFLKLFLALLIPVGIFVGYKGYFFTQRLRMIGQLEATEGWVMRDHNRDSSVLPNVCLEEVNIGVESVRPNARIPPLSVLLWFPELKYLSASGQPLNGDEIQIISRLTKLRTLHLDSTGILDQDLPRLLNLKSLEVMNLCDTNVTDASIPCIQKMTSLRHLWLHNSEITQWGYQKLQATMPNTSITIGHIGSAAHRKATRRLLHHHAKVRSGDALDHPQEVHVSIRPEAWLGTNDDFAALTDLDRLDELWILGKGQVVLPSLPRVRQLHLEGATVLGLDFAELDNDSSLQKVTIEQCPCPPGLLQNLDRCSHLETLRFISVPLSAEELASVKRSESLRELHVVMPEATNYGEFPSGSVTGLIAVANDMEMVKRMYAIGIKFPKLRILILNDNRISDDAVTAFGVCEHLQAVTLESQMLTDNGIARLPNCFPNLKTLKISSHQMTEASLKQFALFRHLTNLTISDGILPVDTMASFSKDNPNCLVKWQATTKDGRMEHTFSKGVALPVVRY